MQTGSRCLRDEQAANGGADHAGRQQTRARGLAVPGRSEPGCPRVYRLVWLLHSRRCGLKGQRVGPSTSGFDKRSGKRWSGGQADEDEDAGETYHG